MDEPGDLSTRMMEGDAPHATDRAHSQGGTNSLSLFAAENREV